MSSPNDPPGAEMTVALYKPFDGKDAELREIIKRHVPYLRSEGLATDRPVVHMRAENGTYVEIFEWVPGAAEAAHSHDGVMKMWGEMMAVADFPEFHELAESQRRFPHFTAVDDLV